MKKIILLVVTFILLFAFAACGVTDSTIEDKLPVQEVVTPDEPEQENFVSDVGEPLEESKTEVTIEEQVIYDENDIKVTAKALEYDDWFGPSITVLVENNSQQNITVQTREQQRKWIYDRNYVLLRCCCWQES